MTAEERIAVWLICLDGKFAGKVLLQKRAPTKIEKGMKKPQSNPLVCQSTCNGKIEKGEGGMEALKREVAEGLGKKFAEQFSFKDLIRFDVRNYTYRSDQIVRYNFVGLITEDQLNLVKLHSGAMPNFVVVGGQDLFFVKDVGDLTANPQKQIVLFSDQFRALKKLFTLRDMLIHLK